MKIFLAGGESRRYIPASLYLEQDMKIYLAYKTVYVGICDEATRIHKPYILESFYYTDEYTTKLLPYYGDFMLDSGAFTFMSSGKHEPWEEYVDQYADFVKANGVQKFFELDLDSVVGYEKTLELRARLEKAANRKCIPVWHKSRGYREFQRMCDEYSYAAIGGIVTKEIKPEQYEAFPAMIADAHKRGCKLHGLGFTSLAWLPKCHFDSVDSTAWTTGNRFGYVYKFDGKTMTKIKVPKGKRLASGRKVAVTNYIEWIKFQKYAEKHFKRVRKPHEKTIINITGMADSIVCVVLPGKQHFSRKTIPAALRHHDDRCSNCISGNVYSV